jgi:TP901 family phage tail tape measure protein
MAEKRLSVGLFLNDKQFQTGLKKATRGLKKFGSGMQKVGRSMTANITAPLGLAAGASVKMAVDFQTSLTKIQTLVGATAGEIQGYEKAIKSISSTTATGQKELADGLFFITSAGLEGQQALDALEVSAKGAAMGMGEMEDIAGAVTSIMAGYADSNMTAGQAGDLLHETLKQGKFEASEFMGSIGQVIPTAVAAGVSFEELGAATATLSKLSGDARGSLTAVNSVMMSLLTPGQQQKDILEEIGMSYDDLQSMLGDSLMGTLQHLFTELDGNNEMLVKVFGSSRAVKAAFGTMGAQAETYANVLEGMQKSQGNVNKGFQQVSQTAGFQLTQAFTDVKNAGIEIGAMLIPVVLKLVAGIRNLVDVFTSLTPQAQQIAVVMGIIVGAMGPLVAIIGGIVTAFMSISLTVAGVIAGVLGLVAAFVYLRENWEAVKERLGDWSFIKNAIISTFQTFIKFNLFSMIIDGMNKLREFLGKDPLPNPFDKVVEGLEDLKEETNEYKHEFGSFTDAVKGQAKEAADALGLLGKSMGVGGTSVAPSDDSQTETTTQTGPTINPTPIVSGNKEIQESNKVTEETFNKLKMTAGNAFSSMAADSEASLADMLKMQANAVRQQIQMYLAEAVAGQIAKIVATVPFPFNIAIAAGAGSLMGSLFNKLIPPFAEGGLVSGATLGIVGEGRGTSMVNPEVIAPLDKLKGMLNQGGSTEVFGRISGADILLSSDRARGNRQRTRGK